MMCEHCSSLAYLKPGCRFSVKESVKQVRRCLTSEKSFPFSPQSIHLPGRQRAGASKHQRSKEEQRSKVCRAQGECIIPRPTPSFSAP